MKEPQELTGTEGLEKIGGLIKHIRFAMLTTVAPDGSINSRPMATQDKEFDGTVWFLTSADTRKVDEIADDSHVVLIYADPDDAKYITIKGRARVTHDQAKIHELWNPMYKAWFREGETDPQIRVLSVNVTEAEFWEASDSKIVRTIKYLTAAATKGGVDVGEYGKVQL